MGNDAMSIRNAHTELRSRIERVRASELRVSLTAGLFLNGAVVAASALLLAVLESIFHCSSVLRTWMVIPFLASSTVSFGWFVGRPLLRSVGILSSDSDEVVARRIGIFFPAIRDRLLNILQLTESPRQEPALDSQALREEAARVFMEETATVDFTGSVNSAAVPSAVRWFVLSALVPAVLLFAFPSEMADALYRLIHFEREFVPPPQFAIEVTPGDRTLVKGDSVNIRVRLIPLVQSLRRLPHEIILFTRGAGQVPFDGSTHEGDSLETFHIALRGLQTTTEYFIRAGEMETHRYTLTVNDYPLLRTLRLRLRPPAYTRQPERVQDDFAGDIEALPGTKVTVSGTANRSLLHGSIVFGDSTRQALRPQESSFRGAFTVKTATSYIVQVTDAGHLSNLDPVRYQIDLVVDQTPSITLLQPGRDLDVAGDESIALTFRVADDYGLRSTRLGYRLAQSRLEQPSAEYSYQQISLPSGVRTEGQVDHLWRIADLRLAPEDVVEYFGEVFDNDDVNGPKSARTTVYRLRFPSLEEVFADADRMQDRSVEDIAKGLEEARKLKEEVEAIDRELKKAKQPDWQTQKQMAAMAKRYEQVQKRIDEAQNRLEQMTQHLQQQNAMSSETLEKFMELQQLFQQIRSEDLQKLLQQMQQQMPSMSKEEFRQALQNVTFNEERFRQSIERTLNLLKRLQIEQKMNEVQKRADALMKEQDEIGKESTNAADPEQRAILAKRQEELAKAEQAMEREAADLQKRMEEFFTEMPADKMQKLNEQLEQQALDRQMQKAAEQMRKGDKSAMQSTQRQIMQQLQQFQQSMSAMQQQMMQEQSQAVINEFRKATYGLLELSRQQEELKQQANAAPPNSSQLRENAQGQQRLTQDLQNLINGLNELSQRSFAVTPEMGRSIGEALSRMNGASQRLESGNGQFAAAEQGQAMGSLNRAAIQVQQALQQMMQSGGSGAGSLMQQLQQMAGQQMALNMQMQKMGEGMSAQQAAEAGRLAREQEAIRKSLEQLNKEAGTSGDRERLLGDLQKIADEMKEVVRDLEQQQVNEETSRRQERILSRLLDASRSMRERDYEKKRKAQTGRAVIRKSPEAIDANALTGRNKLRDELLKALEQGYSKDYQELIRKYFDRLENEK